MAILRSRLHDVLLGHADRAGVEVRSAALVSGYREAEGSVSVTLADGAVVDGDLLIGADGLRSTVRTQLLGGGEPVSRGFTAVRGIGRAPAGEPRGFIAYGRSLILFAAAVGAGDVYWVASVTAEAGVWPGKDSTRAHRDLLTLLNGWRPDLVAETACAVRPGASGVVGNDEPARQSEVAAYSAAS